MVFEKIAQIIAEKLDIPLSDIALSSTFESLNADSLYVVEIMMSIEEEFGISIEDSEGIETVSDIVECVESKLA